MFSKQSKILVENTNFTHTHTLPFNLHDYLEPLEMFSQNFNSNCSSPSSAIRWCRNIAELHTSVFGATMLQMTDRRICNDIRRM